MRRFGNPSPGGPDCLISMERLRQSTFECCPGEIRERRQSPFREPVQAISLFLAKVRDRSIAGQGRRLQAFRGHFRRTLAIVD